MNSRTLGLFMVSAVLAAGIVYVATRGEVTSLQAQYDLSQESIAALRTQNTGISDQMADLQRRLSNQEALTESFRRQADASIGDRLVLTEGQHTAFPKTVKEAEEQGFILMDKVTSESVTASCFAHEGALHYGKPDPTVTHGIEWHGATTIPIYSSTTEELIGLVLESVTPQSAPPWEYHAEGHPSMSFEHWSMHIWFTDPPLNLDLDHELSAGSS